MQKSRESSYRVQKVFFNIFCKFIPDKHLLFYAFRLAERQFVFREINLNFFDEKYMLKNVNYPSPKGNGLVTIQ